MVSLLLADDGPVCVTSTPSAPRAPPDVRRAISSFVAPAHADEVRDATFAALKVRPVGDPLAGLPTLSLEGSRQVFLLARAALALPLEARQVACGSMIEDQYTQESVDEAVSWWAATLGRLLGAEPAETVSSALPPWGLHALYTSGDGNCLLHGALLGTVGVRDTRVPPAGAPGASTAAELSGTDDDGGGGCVVQPRRSLRAALHHAVTRCEPLRALLAGHGALLEPAAAGAETVESRSVVHGHSCDPTHVLALAHIFRRPIVVYAAASVGEVREATDGRTMSSHAAKGERMSGIYLPSLLPPNECASRDPILLAFSSGHFSALCGAEPSADAKVWRALGVVPSRAALPDAVDGCLPVPLVDETLDPLPVLFPPCVDRHDEDDDDALVRRYLDVLDTAPLGPPATTDERRKAIRVALLRVPPPPKPPATELAPADAYFASLWARRVAAATEQLSQPSDPDAVLSAPSASRENSATSATELGESWEIIDASAVGAGVPKRQKSGEYEGEG